MVYSYNRTLDIDIEGNDVFTYVVTRLKLESVMLSERNQSSHKIPHFI